MTRPIAIMNAVTTLTKKEQRGFGLLPGDWQEQLAFIVEAMGEMSLQSDPQAMVRSYGADSPVDAGRPLDLDQPAGPRVAPIPDHALQYLERRDQSLEREGSPAPA